MFYHHFKLCCIASTGTEDLLVIETSGLCDPAPVLSTLEQLEDLALWPDRAAAQFSRKKTCFQLCHVYIYIYITIYYTISMVAFFLKCSRII